MKFWWPVKPSPGNFGDILTPVILNHFKISCEWTSQENAEGLCVGSIARFAKDKTIVLGSGIIRENEILCPTANWKFVRGPLTYKKIIEMGGSCPEIFGDPALLLPIICDESKKKYDVGIIPHYVDYTEVCEKYKNYRIINVLRKDPLEVVREITECRSIVSSSLHGIITAHSYGIPAAWVKFSNKIYGDDSKYYDYYQSVKLDAKLSTVENPQMNSISYDLLKIKSVFENLKYE